MLKTINKKKLKIRDSKSLSDFKNFPRSEKVYVKSSTNKKVNVGMRKISLDDKDIKDLIVYDTSGPYSDKNYIHDYEKGLKKIRQDWIKDRNGIIKTDKTKLFYLDHSKCKSKRVSFNSK